MSELTVALRNTSTGLQLSQRRQNAVIIDAIWTELSKSLQRRRGFIAQLATGLTLTNLMAAMLRSETLRVHRLAEACDGA